jgi:hypothetical protein
LRRNRILKHVIQEKVEEIIEMTGRRGRGRKRLLDDLREMTGYWKLKQKALYGTMWSTLFEETMDFS